MTESTVFINNRTQAVRLPIDVRFPPRVKKVDIRIQGNERIIAPADSAWDSFFLAAQMPTEDFMEERACQEQADREAL